MRREPQRHFGLGGGEGGCFRTGGRIFCLARIENKLHLGFGRKANPGANRIGQVYGQKHGAGRVLWGDMKGKNHLVEVAKSLGSIFVNAHWHRIGNRYAGGIRRSLEGKFWRNTGTAGHAPIGESARIEADFDPGTIEPV